MLSASLNKTFPSFLPSGSRTDYYNIVIILVFYVVVVVIVVVLLLLFLFIFSFLAHPDKIPGTPFINICHILQFGSPGVVTNI